MAVVVCGYACIPCMLGEHGHSPWLCDAHGYVSWGRRRGLQHAEEEYSMTWNPASWPIRSCQNLTFVACKR